ncbi:hypothetical protein BCR37DRAFT_122999 [Protomyces lactucae-debilis]|uniref:Dilute domain-containing protein n=1 Tax=Protomyces lactucae-debilis TaxID=2754530 RepID=A0A1Y2F283_PROLT|nr:uncharacterized protein BCR37DRAFT_122999 [Protomyces lactucae-debilis]ORY77817.1 hypothetical protein BCR37DRAFT_122999 [Protomyces lactucae-debilis]
MEDPWSQGQPEQDTLQAQFLRGCLSNDFPLVSRLLSDPGTLSRIRIDAPDEAGSPAILTASCFGYAEMVELLLDAGANVDAHDARGWSALMWASNNNHGHIAKLLMEHGAKRDAVSKSGYTASDFASTTTLKESLSPEGSLADEIGTTGTTGSDWYGAHSALDFEESLREEEQSRRMALEAGINLEVDMGALSLGNEGMPEDDDLEEEDSENAFVWDHCLPSQMFVFSEASLPDMLKLAITDYPPLRASSQRLVPANLLFLAARFAHYFSTPQLLHTLLHDALETIEEVVNQKQEDMTVLAFWISNCLLLQYYLRKEPQLVLTTSESQLRISELINEIYVLVVRDAERRIEKVLTASMLDYCAIDLSELEMSDEWRLFKRKQPSGDGSLSPRRRRGASPRNITGLLSSTLYVLEAYAIHPSITVQALSQILFWLASELFNRILQNKKYLSRGKAMDLRMNVSQIEEWIRNNNRAWQDQPDLATRCSSKKGGLRRLVGLLQLLQCLSSLGESEVKQVVDSIEGITARQALFVAEGYRSERAETKIARAIKVQLVALEREQSATIAQGTEGIFLDATEQLSFKLPTSTDLILSYGSGIGGTQRDNEKLFTPTLPLELIEKLDALAEGGDGQLKSTERAKGYAGMTSEGPAEVTDEADAPEHDGKKTADEQERIANAVGEHSGVW